MRRFTLAALVAAAFFVVGVVAAGAATPTSTDQLKFFTGGVGTISWTSEAGSSTDDNQSLRLAGTTQGVDYSGAYAVGATSVGVPLANFKAGFDLKGYAGAGSPRISLPVDTNADGNTDLWAYLSALYCSTGQSQANGFTRYDFQNQGCLIYTSTGVTLNGLSDPAASSQTASGTITYQYGTITFAVHDAEWTVAGDYQPFLILDEAPAVSYIDHLVVGNYGWDRPGKPGIQVDTPVAPSTITQGGTMSWTNGVSSFVVNDISSVVIDTTHVAFSGHMASGTGQWAAYDGQVIQEYVDTANSNLYGLIGGTNIAPSSTIGLEGPFPYTGA
jgi:hypothetical protein